MDARERTQHKDRDRSRQRTRAWVSSFVGSTIEFYDFIIYTTAAALVFGTVFFPTADPAAGIIASFATLGVGYLARPLGAVLFGHWGDRVGRRSALITTLVVMGVATTLIGLLPTYEQIGVGAPVLLTLLRLVQGIAVGGEWGGAVLMSVEHSRTERRGFFGSATQTGTSFGGVLAFGVFGLLTAVAGEALLAWAWRIPFLVSFLLMGIGLYIRMRVDESPVLLAERADRGAPVARPLVEVLRAHRRTVLLAIGLGVGPYVFQTIAQTFAVTFAVTEYGVPRSTVLGGLTLAAAVGVVTNPAFAALSDRVGRRPLYLTGTTLMLLTALVFFPALQAGLVVPAYVVLIGIVYPMTFGAIGALFAEMFPTGVRYTAVGLSYQLMAVVGGGFAPLAAASLAPVGGIGAVVVLIVVACALSLACLLAVRETRSVDLRSVGSAAGPGSSQTGELRPTSG